MSISNNVSARAANPVVSSTSSNAIGRAEMSLEELVDMVQPNFALNDREKCKLLAKIKPVYTKWIEKNPGGKMLISRLRAAGPEPEPEPKPKEPEKPPPKETEELSPEAEAMFAPILSHWDERCKKREVFHNREKPSTAERLAAYKMIHEFKKTGGNQPIPDAGIVRLFHSRGKTYMTIHIVRYMFAIDREFGDDSNDGAVVDLLNKWKIPTTKDTLMTTRKKCAAGLICLPAVTDFRDNFTPTRYIKCIEAQALYHAIHLAAGHTTEKWRGLPVSRKRSRSEKN